MRSQLLILVVIVTISHTLAAYDSNGGSCQLSCSEKYDTASLNFACNRGCRFSAINQFLSLAYTGDSSHECEDNCKSAYADDSVVQACVFGCNSQGILSPLGQMLESQPNFGADPVLSPGTFFDAVSTFLDDFSSAVGSRVPGPGGEDAVIKPIGFMRIIHGSFPDAPQTHVISVKLSSKASGPDGFLSSDQLFGSDIESDPDASKSDTLLLKSNTNKCLAPLYQTLPGPKCRAYFPRWQFNRATGKCEKFIFGGCPEAENMFSSFEECDALCSQLVDQYQGVEQNAKSFELWLLIFCFGALGLCALLGAVSSACLYCFRRKRLRCSQNFIRHGQEREEEAKIFLVAPQMSWSSELKGSVMTLPPTYADVLKATKDHSADEVATNFEKKSDVVA